MEKYELNDNLAGFLVEELCSKTGDEWTDNSLDRGL